MGEVRVLLVGDVERREFRAAREVLARHVRLACAEGAAEAESRLAGGELSPDLVVLAQAFPGEFTHAEVERLRRLAPLARFVGLLGSWCEGEGRSGEPWPGVVRVYWHQWPARARRELSRLARGESAAWAMPPTATEEERLLSETPERRQPFSGLVAIHTRWSAMEEWISAACRRRGCATVWLRPPHAARIEGAAAAVFDAADLSDDEAGPMRRLSESVAPAPLIALLDFPRIDDQRRALACGAAAMLSKPLQVEDLLGELDRLTGAARH